MSKSRRNQALWDYLEAIGVLQNGSKEDIKAAKRAYRKDYLLAFKRRQRSAKAEYTISFSKADGEHGRIVQAARTHAMSVSAFVRKAALAYLDQTYLVPHPHQVVHLERLLSECLNEIKAIGRSREKFFWERENKLERIETLIEKMERRVDEALRHPPLLNQNDHQDKIA